MCLCLNVGVFKNFILTGCFSIGLSLLHVYVIPFGNCASVFAFTKAVACNSPGERLYNTSQGRDTLTGRGDNCHCVLIY